MAARSAHTGTPMAPGALPLVGHVPALVRDPARWLAACRDTGGIVTVRLGTRRAHLVCSSELVHELLVGQVDRFDKGGPLFDRVRVVTGDGLITARHRDHRRQRPLMQPAFSPAHVSAYTAAMREECAALTARWGPRQRIRALSEMHSLLAGVLVRVLLHADDLPDGAWLAAQVKTLVSGITTRTVLPWAERLPLPGNRRFQRALREIHGAADRAVDASRSRPEQSRLMAALLAPDLDGDAFTDEDLRGQVVTLLGAGIETTAATLVWAFLLLARHPEIEARLYEELDTVLGGRLATPDDFRRLPLTRTVVLETLRMYPVAWMLTRVTTADVELGGHRFAAGEDFLFSPYQLHHDPAVFPRPGVFDPGRWAAPP
ncbi:cytochrome P450, partial [Streptomyces clavuligerus]